MKTPPYYQKVNKNHYNVLVVCSMKHAGRNFFAGILDVVSNKDNWHLSTVRPGRFFGIGELVDEDGKPFDGLIISLPGTDEVMQRIAESHIPTVLVNITDQRISARYGAIASVWIDNADIGRRAAQHLLERGEYKSAGYVHELSYQFYSYERMTAFSQVMKSRGLETSTFPGNYLSSAKESDQSDRTAIFQPPSAEFFSGLREWVRDLPKPAAVMATSDMRAADVINACQSEGIPVPSQVAIIGVDHDIAQHEKCGMSISSVALNMRMMGQQSIRELNFLFKHPKWKGRVHEVLIPVRDVFAGESTSRSIPATRLVKMALDFIAINRTRRLVPPDVIAHLGCSRQLANLRFSQVAKMTIRQAIEKIRMEEAQRRLKAGESAKSIVKSMHFTSDNQFYRIYKRHFGHTLRQSDI